MSNDLRYESIAPVSESEVLERLESAKFEIVAEALYAATKHEGDWKWVQDTCLAALLSPSMQVRRAAATCLGDLAFLRRQLDAGVVIKALEQACEDPAIADPARVSLSMVKQFATH
jgi:hypothetical protein